jgi:hypothetical protein
MTESTRYFDLWDDMRFPGRWHLRSPVDARGQQVDPWQFKEGRRLALEEVPLFRLARPGTPLDFTLTGFTLPLLHERVVQLLERWGLQREVQFIPARVEGQSCRYSILNALRIIRCIDDARCEEVAYWTPEDGEPDRVGEYQKVRGLRVDPEKTGGADIFRPWGWTGALIVSERVRRALESAGVAGPVFVEV